MRWIEGSQYDVDDGIDGLDAGDFQFDTRLVIHQWPGSVALHEHARISNKPELLSNIVWW